MWFTTRTRSLEELSLNPDSVSESCYLVLGKLFNLGVQVPRFSNGNFLNYPKVGLINVVITLTLL